MMARLSVRYPGYGWERNQGYATLEHRNAIRALGLTPFHRRSFLALQRTLAGEQETLDLFALEGLDLVGLPVMAEQASGAGVAVEPESISEEFEAAIASLSLPA
jgi:hypothetical protein